MKIIYLFDRRLPYRGDDIKFGYNVFLEKGYKLEVWSLAKWLYGFCGDSETLSGNATIDDSKYVSIINSEDEFLNNIKRISNEKTFFFCYPYSGHGKFSFYVRKTLHNNNIPFANITLSPYLHGINKRYTNINIIKTLILIFRNFIVRNIYYLFRGVVPLGSKRNFFREIADSIYSFTGYLLYPSVYNFVTTTLMYSSYPNPLERWSNRNILICANSYDEYLQSLNSNRIIPEKYIVFLDQGLLTIDNRFIAQGIDIPINNKEKYCKELKRLFEYLENQYHCSVVIAAHPKAGYKGNEFGNRRIIFNKTPQLVKDAELVINQISTAFGLAVLHKKDVLEVYTPDMFNNNLGWRKCYEDYEKMGLKPLNISNRMEVERAQEYVFHYDEEVYGEYIDILIKSNESIGEGKTFYQCVYEYIDKWRIEKGWSIKE